MNEISCLQIIACILFSAHPMTSILRFHIFSARESVDRFIPQPERLVECLSLEPVSQFFLLRPNKFLEADDSVK